MGVRVGAGLERKAGVFCKVEGKAPAGEPLGPWLYPEPQRGHGPRRPSPCLLGAAAMGSPAATRANLVGEGEPVGHDQSRGQIKTALFIEANALMSLILHVFVMKEFTSDTF